MGARQREICRLRPVRERSSEELLPAQTARYLVSRLRPLRLPERRRDALGAVAFCRGALASYKAPRHVFMLTAAEVPRIATGKVEKPAPRREAARRIADD